VLNKIKIRNFKSLRDTGELRFGNRNIFIGPNGSGKTNTIDALKFLTNIAVSGMSRAIGDRNGFLDVFWKGQSEDSVISFDASFSIFVSKERIVEASYLLEIEGNQSGLVTVKRELLNFKGNSGDPVPIIDMYAGHGKVLTMDGSKAFDPPGNPAVSMLEFNVPGWDGSLFKQYLSSFHFYRLIPFAMRQIRQFTRANFLTEHGENLVEYITTLKTTHSECFNRIERVMQDTFPGLEQLIPEPTQAGQVFLTTREKYLRSPIRVWSLPDGELAFLALVSLILAPPEMGAPIVSVEEPENHLHPKLLTTLVELLNGTQTRLSDEGIVLAQVFATTHSPSLVNSFAPEDVLVVEKKEGGTKYTRASDRKGLKDLLSRNELGLGELWHSGVIGG
jgi:predicted ATPase